MQIQTQGVQTAEFLLTEAPGSLSREQIAVAAGDALPAGQLLEQDADGTGYVPYGTTEEGKAAAILYAPLRASETDRRATAIVRLAEVAEARLTGLDAKARTDLLAAFIAVR